MTASLRSILRIEKRPYRLKEFETGLVPVRGPKQCFKSWVCFWRGRESSRPETRNSGLKHRKRGVRWDSRVVSVRAIVIARSG